MTFRKVIRMGFVLIPLAIGIGFASLYAKAPNPVSKPRPAPPLGSEVRPLDPANYDDTLQVGGEAIAAKKVDTRLLVSVDVNGRGPFRFIVDSGADSSAVGIRLASDLNLPLGSSAILNSSTAREIVDRVKVESLSFGGSALRDLELPALRELHLGGDGLIGIDALVNQRLMMDFVKRQIKVEDARRPMPHEPGEIVVTARRKRGQLILTKVTARGFSLDAVIDTGSEVTIGNTLLREKLLKGHHPTFYKATAIGVTGKPLALEMTVIDRLEIGPIVLYDVPMAFADVPPFELFGLDKQPALLLGTDLLEGFRKVSLDFRSRKVRFHLRRCSPQDSYGLIVRVDPTAATLAKQAQGGQSCYE